MQVFISKKTYLHIAPWILLIFVSIGATHAVSAQPDEHLQDEEVPDPIFSVGYGRHEVHFEMIKTAVLLPICNRLLADLVPLPTEMTLYAKSITKDKTIYIVGEKGNLKILVSTKTGCDGGIPLLSITHTHHHPIESWDSPVLTEEEVARVFEDTLIRHEIAFGGKKAFLKWLDEKTLKVRSRCVAKKLPELRCPPTYFTLQPILQQKLLSYRSAN